MRVFRYTIGLMSLSILAIVVGLLSAATVTPLVMGWERVVVTSGSMQPGIRAGDIVLADPKVEHPVDPGTVLVFGDPDRDGGLLTHRVVEVLPDGGYRTAGDANQSADTFTVAPETVIGRGMALVPAVGTATAWMHQGHPERTAAALAGTALLIWFSRYGLLDRFDPWSSPANRRPVAAGARRPAGGRRAHLRDTPRTSRPNVRRRALTVVGSLALLIVGAGAVVVPKISEAAFTAGTGNAANLLRVACQSQTVIATADTYVESGTPDRADGSAQEFKVASHASNARAFLRFPTSTVPSGCTIVSVKLRVWARSSTTGRTIQAAQVTGAWSETTTWNTQPAITGPLASTVSVLGWNEWDVTEQAKAMLSSGSVDLRLSDSVEGQQGERQLYGSRESAYKPELVLTLN